MMQLREQSIRKGSWKGNKKQRKEKEEKEKKGPERNQGKRGTKEKKTTQTRKKKFLWDLNPVPVEWYKFDIFIRKKCNTRSAIHQNFHHAAINLICVRFIFITGSF